MALSPRLLKGSAFSPRSISGLALWLDASDSSTLFQNSDGTVPATASSDPVGYWADKSGNGRHAVQATAGSRPTISATAQNGRNALAFDGSNGWMRTERTTYAARSVFTVFRRTGTATTYSSPFAKQSTVAAGYGGSSYAVAYGNEGGWSIVGSGTGRLNYSSNGSPHKLSAAYMRGAAIPLADAQNYLTGIVAAPNTTDAELLYAEAATDTNGNQAWFLGTEPFATTRKYPANILEVLIYSRALTAAERQRLERYLAARWGITLAPQVGNADAQNWIDRVYANGGTVSSATAASVNQFCQDLENAPGGSIRDRFYRLNLFCGNSDASLAAVRTPLFRGPSLGGTQYGGTTDTNNNFLPGDYAENSGLLGNGTTQYLNTGVPMNFANLRDYHLSAYVASVTGNAGFIGADTDGDGVSPRGFQSLASFASATRVWVWYNIGTTFRESTNSSNSYTPGLLTGVGSAAANNLYVGASSVASVGAGTNETISRTFPVYVFAHNGRNTNVLSRAAARMGSYSMGLAMTATQVGHYNTALAAFNSALGRA